MYVYAVYDPLLNFELVSVLSKVNIKLVIAQQ